VLPPKTFAYELSLRNSVSFVKQLVQHLIANGADLSNTVLRTDNGSEFTGSWNAKKDSAFTEKVESCSMIHKTIPPKAHTWQADAETSHSLIEYEFYTIEAFNSTPHLQQKMAVYLLWFNFLRKNSYKENQTPLQIGLAKVSELNNKISNFKSEILDHCYGILGYKTLSAQLFESCDLSNFSKTQSNFLSSLKIAGDIYKASFSFLI
jgi:hypothetical protein